MSVHRSPTFAARGRGVAGDGPWKHTIHSLALVNRFTIPHKSPSMNQQVQVCFPDRKQLPQARITLDNIPDSENQTEQVIVIIGRVYRKFAGIYI